MGRVAQHERLQLCTNFQSKSLEWKTLLGHRCVCEGNKT